MLQSLHSGLVAQTVQLAAVDRYWCHYWCTAYISSGLQTPFALI